MGTVLITYSTPPPPRAARDAGEGKGTDVADVVSVGQMVAGIDEAIAQTISTELGRAGHQVTCRPCVAATTQRGFDLVVLVDRLHVSHRSDMSWPRVTGEGEATPPCAVGWASHGRAARVRPHEAPGGETGAESLGEATIPMTWCADFRAVEAWGQSLGDHLAHFLELRAELSRIRAELARCRALLKAATPEPRAASAVELGRPTGTVRTSTQSNGWARRAETGQRT